MSEYLPNKWYAVDGYWFRRQVDHSVSIHKVSRTHTIGDYSSRSLGEGSKPYGTIE